MQGNRLIVASAVLAIAAFGAADLPLKLGRIASNDTGATPQHSLQQEQAKEIWIGDVLTDDETLSYHGYLVEKRHKKVRYEFTDEFDQRAIVLETLLALIYVGKQNQAWEFYNRSYNLSDKEEIRHRVKAILNRQPVYKFIYNLRSHK